MKRIVKSKEPPLLLTHRRESFADYDNYSKGELRASLLTEQGYICCYCMQRISDLKMKIEHWKPQDKYPELKLNYSNLLGACQGSQGSPYHLQHCDTKKGNTEITINPTNNHRNCEDLIKYSIDGRIYSDDTIIDAELNEVLNLNMQTLKNNRGDILKLAIKNLTEKRSQGNWTVAMLNKEINKWSNKQQNAQYKAYCQIVVYYLRKKLLKLTNNRI